MARDIDQALFDFDEDIDHLEEVDDRYPVINQPNIDLNIEMAQEIDEMNNKINQIAQETED